MTELTTIVLGKDVPPPAFQCVVTSSFSFGETVARLKQSAEDAELWLLHELDPQRILERGGYLAPSVRQLLLFHPRYMVRLLRVDPNAIVEAPLRFIVLEMPDGTVTVRCLNIAERLALYDGLLELGHELAALSQHLLDAVKQQPSRPA